jgi:hypothetical protein
MDDPRARIVAFGDARLATVEQFQRGLDCIPNLTARFRRNPVAFLESPFDRSFEIDSRHRSLRYTGC